MAAKQSNGGVSRNSRQSHNQFGDASNRLGGESAQKRRLAGFDNTRYSEDVSARPARSKALNRGAPSRSTAVPSRQSSAAFPRQSTSATRSRVRTVRTRGAADQRESYSRGDMRKRTGQSFVVRLTAAATVVALVGSAILFGLPILQALFAPPEFVVGREIEVYIPEGSSARGIAKILDDNGVIPDQNEFIKVCRSMAVADSLKPGKYIFVSGTALEDLVTELVAGPLDDSYRLTIPEGFTIGQIARRVEAVCGIPAEEFLAEANNAAEYTSEFPFLAGCYNNSLEGFLYPKTYRVPIGADAGYVIRTLLIQFSIETRGVDFSYAASRGLSAYDVLVIASLIERETANAEERALVSSVIYNRLEVGMYLQIDATVVYALNDNQRDYLARPLLYSDLEVASPYNTYRNPGLPPGPICSPRVQSLLAAARPEQTDYYYYVVTSLDYTHTFCRNEEEFDQAQAVYRRVFGLE